MATLLAPQSETGKNEANSKESLTAQQLVASGSSDSTQISSDENSKTLCKNEITIFNFTSCK